MSLAACSPTERRLLAAIHDDHEADGPRLAWADWLTAQGNPWGDVVRTAVALAAKGRPPSRALLAAQRTHRAAGLGPLAAQISADPDDVTFDRGLLSGAVLCALDHSLAALTYPGQRPTADALDDPRWRGVRWLRDGGRDDVLALLRAGLTERLTALHHLSVEGIVALGALPLAASLRSLHGFARDEHGPLLTPALLAPFSALENLSLDDLTDDDDPDGPPARIGRLVHGWLPRSRVARSLRRLGTMSDLRLATVLRELPRFGPLEAVRFHSFELVRSPRGLTLFFFGTSAWLLEKITALKIAAGTIATVEVDARIADRRKDGRAALRALAAHLGARLVIHAKPTFRSRVARWDWFD